MTLTSGNLAVATVTIPAGATSECGTLTAAVTWGSETPSVETVTATGSVMGGYYVGSKTTFAFRD